LKKLLYILTSLGIFAALLIFPKAAAEAVKEGLMMCGQMIIPSLFPFFIAVNLLNELGASRLISNALAPFGARLGISGQGVSAFIIGVTGGYPLGAAYIARLRSQGLIGRDEASRLLVFCNNSGPAFIVGAAGIGVFSSTAVGFLLYAVHILAALILWTVSCPKVPCDICYDEDMFAPSRLYTEMADRICFAAEDFADAYPCDMADFLINIRDRCSRAFSALGYRMDYSATKEFLENRFISLDVGDFSFSFFMALYAVMRNSAE